MITQESKAVNCSSRDGILWVLGYRLLIEHVHCITCMSRLGPSVLEIFSQTLYEIFLIVCHFLFFGLVYSDLVDLVSLTDGCYHFHDSIKNLEMSDCYRDPMQVSKLMSKEYKKTLKIFAFYLYSLGCRGYPFCLAKDIRYFIFNIILGGKNSMTQQQ